MRHIGGHFPGITPTLALLLLGLLVALTLAAIILHDASRETHRSTNWRNDD